MIRHVYERAQASNLGPVVVATDDTRVADAVRAFGGEVEMTDPELASGTDRVAACARARAEAGAHFDCVVNVQGDEPTLEPTAIGEAVTALEETGAEMATLARTLAEGELEDPSVVKVVIDTRGRALYFSRAPLGQDRDVPGRSAARAHVGLYVYRADFLQTFASLAPTSLETYERLEQLRALEHGHRIAVGHTRWRGRGIDTPEDLERLRNTLS